jgi:uncharacterized membrane protein YdjX (TVP38/TMEM64 family)
MTGSFFCYALGGSVGARQDGVSFAPEGRGSMRTDRWYRSVRVYGVLACCVIAAALALGYIFRGFLWEHAVYLYDLLGNRERLQELLKDLGPWAPLLYILFQAVQVVVAPLPGEATGGFVSGFLFGPWLGLLYSLIGLTIGSVGGFLLGRWIGAPIVARLVPPEVEARFKTLAKRRAALAGFVVFAWPYFPKDYFCILLGLCGMSLRTFLVVQILGRLPSSLLFNLQGAELYERNYFVFFLLIAVLLVVAAAAFVLKERIYRYLARSGGAGN